MKTNNSIEITRIGEENLCTTLHTSYMAINFKHVDDMSQCRCVGVDVVYSYNVIVYKNRGNITHPYEIWKKCLSPLNLKYRFCQSIIVFISIMKPICQPSTNMSYEDVHALRCQWNTLMHVLILYSHVIIVLFVVILLHYAFVRCTSTCQKIRLLHEVLILFGIHIFYTKV